MKAPWNVNAAVRSSMRRVFSRSPLVIEVLTSGRRVVPRYKKDGTRHKVDAVQFSCQLCQAWVGRDYIAVDHIIPVIDITTGFVDWNTFYDRLFCITAGKDNLQRICEECHQKKTNLESLQRRTIKYNLELDIIEKEIGLPKLDVKQTIKRLSKYTCKTKPESIRNRASKLKTELLKPRHNKRRNRP